MADLTQTQNLPTRKALTAERLREVLRYDPDTGIFTRRSGGNGVAAGAVAGCLDRLGYRLIKIDREKYSAHRLAWLYMKGNYIVDSLIGSG